MTNEKKYGSLEVPLWHKWLLDVQEADAYFGIGRDKLKEMSNEKGCTFVVFNGKKRLFKRVLLENYLNNMYSV